MQCATCLQFYYAIADPKYLNNIFNKNSLNAILFKLQVILLIMESNEESESGYYSLSYWERLPSYSQCCSHVKVAK